MGTEAGVQRLLKVRKKRDKESQDRNLSLRIGRRDRGTDKEIPPNLDDREGKELDWKNFREEGGLTVSRERRRPSEVAR